MCGIAGVSLNTDKKVAGHGVALFKRLLIENTKRGKDSTGIVYQYKEGTEIYRGLLPGEDAQNFILPAGNIIGFLGHTRYATVGKKSNYDNIHPFETEKYIGVHNGTIFNHKLLKKYFKLDTVGGCDSEVIYRLLDKFGLDGLKYVEGLYMLAYIHKDKPEELNLITNGSKPMVLFKLHGELVAFGSIGKDTKEIAEDYWGKLKKKHGFEEIKPCTLYRLKNGKILERRDLSSKIKYMSEKEGELRYKVDYKILKKDFYQMALPMNRRLMPTEPAKTSAVVTKWGKKAVWGNNKAQGTMFGPESKCRASNAEPKVLAWAYEHTNNFMTLLNSNMCPPIHGTDNVFMSVETMGIPIHFADDGVMNDYIRRELYGVGPSEEVDLKTAKIKNPMVSVFPNDNGLSRIWLPSLIQATQLFNAMVFSDMTTLYTKYAWSGGMPKASNILAASLCNLVGLPQLEELAEYIRAELVETKILKEDVLIIKDDADRRGFERIAKEKGTVVFSKKNFILSSFMNTHYRNEGWYSPMLARRKLEELSATAAISAEDLCATGRGFFMSEMITRLCERIALDGERIYTPKTVVPYNKLDDVAKILHGDFNGGKKREIQEFISYALDMRNTAYHCRMNHDLDSFEAAHKEQIKCYFGNVYLNGSPIFLDLPHVLNQASYPEQTLEVSKKMVHRIRLLHDFVIYGNTPEVAGEYYSTSNLKERK
jgi:hypothetical protein